jgi:hypothetical protein
VEVVAELVAVVDEVAALAIAAPPPATAAVTASVVRNGLIRLDMVHLLGGLEADDDPRAS